MADLPVIGIRFALYADLMLLTGLAVFPLYMLGRDEHRDANLTAAFVTPQRWLAAIGLLVSALGMTILTANMLGVDLASVDFSMLATMIGETDVGAAWLVRMAALGVATGATWGLSRRPVPASTITAIAGAIALATLAWTGHASATEGLAGTLHRISDGLHLIAAAIWLGAIAAFLLILRPRRGVVPPSEAALAARSLPRFARTGTICVLVLAATGLINAQLIVGIANVGRSLMSPYGQLLVAKLLLFVAMLALAGANRWRLTPALATALIDGDARLAINAMRRSLAIEALAGVAILALVALFGTLEPVP